MTETSPSAPVRIAAIQTVSGPDVAANLETAARLIAEAAAAVPMICADRDHRYEVHPVLDLLRRPNPG